MTPAKTLQLAAGRFLTATDGAKPNPTKAGAEARTIRGVLDKLHPLTPTAPPAYVIPPLPSITAESVDVPPGSTSVRVAIRLSGPTPQTIRARVVTNNGADPDHAGKSGIAGINFTPVNKYLTFKPGDPLVQYIDIAVKGMNDGRWFTLIFPEENAPSELRTTGARITARAGAEAQAPVDIRPPHPLATPQKGALIYSLDIPNFKATPNGGPGIWKTSFPNGRRAQPGNQEMVTYTDPTQHPGTRSWEVRDGILYLRAEPLAKPLNNGYGFQNISASILTSEAFLTVSEGYFEVDAKCPPKGWPAPIWAHAGDGKVSELDACERWSYFNRFMTHCGLHHEKGHFMGKVRTDAMGSAIDFTADFHKHGVDWRKDRCTWFVDGVEVFQCLNPGLEKMFFLMGLTMDANVTTLDAPLEMAIRSFNVWA